MKCDVCGKRFRPKKDNVYKVKISKDSVFAWDAIDCPRCGCQRLMAARKPKFDVV